MGLHKSKIAGQRHQSTLISHRKRVLQVERTPPQGPFGEAGPSSLVPERVRSRGAGASSVAVTAIRLAAIRPGVGLRLWQRA